MMSWRHCTTSRAGRYWWTGPAILVPWLADSSRHNCRGVMVGELLVAGMDDPGTVTFSGPMGRGGSVVGNDDLSCSTDKFKGLHMCADPRFLLHVGKGPTEHEARKWQDRNKQVGLTDLPGDRICHRQRNKFRQDPDATDRQALSAALGVCALLVVVAALIFALLGIRR